VQNSATAVLNTALTFGFQQLLTTHGAAVYTDSIALAAQLAALLDGNLSIEATLTLATAVALSDSVLRVIDGDLPLGTIVQALAASVASIGASTGFGLHVGQSVTGGLDIDVECALTWTLAMTANGVKWEILTTAPSGRVVAIQSSDRVITIQASDRAIQVQPSDRLLNILH
jgi:hypothetical protein